MSDKKVSAGIYIEKDLLGKIDAYLEKSNCQSRSEFICQSVKYYIAFLQKDDGSEFLTPALESVVSGQVTDSENRIARVIFKLAVEMSMLLHVVAKDYDCSENDLDRLRGYCVDEIKRINGKFGFEEAHRHQRGE